MRQREKPVATFIGLELYNGMAWPWKCRSDPLRASYDDCPPCALPALPALRPARVPRPARPAPCPRSPSCPRFLSKIHARTETEARFIPELKTDTERVRISRFRGGHGSYAAGGGMETLIPEAPHRARSQLYAALSFSSKSTEIPHSRRATAFTNDRFISTKNLPDDTSVMCSNLGRVRSSAKSHHRYHRSEFSGCHSLRCILL